MAIMTIMEQIDGEMVNISCDSIRGKTIRECYDIFQGKKVVMEWVESGFVCGTEPARDYYRRIGKKAITFTEGLVLHKDCMWMDYIPVPYWFCIPGSPLQFEYGEHITMDKT